MASRLAQRSVLGAAAGVFVIGVAVVATGTAGDGDPTATTASTEPSPSSTLAPPRSDQIRLAGTVDSAEFTGILDAPIPLPITLEVGAAGLGNGADITDVVVDGEPASIIWDGGRPLQLSGAGSLLPDPTTFVVVDDSFRVELDNRFHGLSPGRYDVATPVAIGREGVAEPRDAVTFDVVGEALVAARGAVSVALPDGSWPLIGPGTATLQGRFDVETQAGTDTAEVLHLPDGGLFELSISVTGDGVRVDGVLQGDFEIDGDEFELPPATLAEPDTTGDPDFTEDPTLGGG